RGCEETKEKCLSVPERELYHLQDMVGVHVASEVYTRYNSAFHCDLQKTIPAGLFNVHHLDRG
ncbi:jg27313, partial [Pararge aegeria aegeria]